MRLKIELPRNLLAQQLVRQSDIPCVCRIGRTFEIRLDAPLPPAVGTVEDWDRDALEERAPAGAGGEWTHHRNGRITLRPVAEGVYEIEHLALFYEGFGWVPVIVDSVDAQPMQLWDEE
jgi:hypothetical protein